MAAADVSGSLIMPVWPAHSPAPAAAMIAATETDPLIKALIGRP